MKSPESHIKICQPKNWAKFFPYSFYKAGWKSSILGWFFPIGITCDFEKRQFGLLCPTFNMYANFNTCLLTPKRNALLWSRLVLGWVQRNSNFGSLDHRLPPHCQKIKVSIKKLYSTINQSEVSEITIITLTFH